MANINTGKKTIAKIEGFEKADFDFPTPLGHLLLLGDDTRQGSALVPKALKPDIRAPSVMSVNPPAGAKNQPLSSRIGIAFSDLIQTSSVNPSTFTVKEANGGIVSGWYGLQNGVVNFTPDKPLKAGTTYEIRIKAGGVKDYAGNSFSENFVSNFSTGNKITPVHTEHMTPLSGPSSKISSPFLGGPVFSATDKMVNPLGKEIRKLRIGY